MCPEVTHRTEFATRLTLGAGRARIVRQLMTEGVLLATTGAAIGLLITPWVVEPLLRIGTGYLPRVNEVSVDWATIGFGLTIAVVAGTSIGAASSAIVLSVNIQQLLVERTRSNTGGRGIRAVRHTLAVAQIALACILVTGAGLLLVSFERTLSVEPGFSAAGVVTATTNLSLFSDDDALRTFMSRALAALREVPGVLAVGATNGLPFDGSYSSRLVVPAAKTLPQGVMPASARWLAITPGYLEALGIPLVAGRRFDERDHDKAPRVAIVDERLARTFWADRDPVGERLYVPLDANDAGTMSEPTHFLTVVGVVRTIRLEDLAGDQPTVGAFYYPFAQGRLRPAFMARAMKFAIRTGASVDVTVTTARARLASLEPNLPLFNVRTMNEWTALSLRARKSALALALAVAALALGLSLLGVYGALVYLVAQRARELGIRIALGGTIGSIFELVLREGAWLAAAGVGFGMAGNILLAQTLHKYLNDVRPLDPFILGVIATGMSLLTLLACAVPARRATRTDPIAVLSQT